MKVLVIGGGGREHAVIRKLKENPSIEKLFCAPGNGGIADLAECVNLKADDVRGITEFAVQNHVDFVCVTPDDPLALGMVDALEAAGIKTFGPVQKAAENAAKAYAGNCYKKVIFKNGKWFDLKSHEWPYRKNGEETWVYIIAEFQGKSYILETGLTRDVKGNNYRIQTPVGNMAQPLK